MNVFDEYTRKVLLKLNEHKVEYIVIGGYAVNYHGFIRTTGDIDLWIRPDNGENKTRLLECLRDLEVPNLSIERVKRMDFTKPNMFRDGEQPFRIDFITHISRVEFNDAWSEKQNAEIEGVKINFLQLNHLIISKMGTGRSKDMTDIEELQKIQAIRKKKK